MPRRKASSTSRSSKSEPKSAAAPTAIDPPPDPEGVAADILGGSSNEGPPLSATERSRRFRAKQRGEPDPTLTPPAPPTIELTAAEAGGMVSAMWDIAVIPLCGRWDDGTAEGLPRLRSLNEKQTLRMGEAFAPLVTKWAPVLGPYMLELTALIVTVNVVRECVTERPRIIEVDLDELRRTDAAVAPAAG